MLPFPIISQLTIQPAKPTIQALNFVENGVYLLYSTGELFFRGRGNSGYKGDGTNTDDQYNSWNPSNTNVIMVSTGPGPGVVIKNDGTYWITANSNYMGLSTGYTQHTWSNCTSKFTAITSNPGNIKQIVSTGGGVFVLLYSGELYAIGSNAYGCLGLGTSTSYSVTDFTLVGTDVKKISASANHAMYIDNNNALFSTGYNIIGQLGNDSTTTGISFTKLTLGSINSYPFVQDVVCISNSTIVISRMTAESDNIMLACGAAARSGSGTPSGGYTTFVYIDTMSGATARVSALSSTMGSANNNMIMTEKGLYAIGFGQYYQLGTGNANNVSVWTAVKSLPTTDYSTIKFFGSSTEGSAFVYQDKVYIFGVSGQWGAISSLPTLSTDTPY